MTEITSTPTLAPYNGFDLAIGSVFGVRWFDVDAEGRLRSRVYNTIWKPGENVAKCRREDDAWGLYGSFMQHYTLKLSSPLFGGNASQTPSLSAEAVEARVEVEHRTPADSCRCGFYAYAEGCDDGEYKTDSTLMGVVEFYGRVILGTKGMRAEKARVVGLVGASRRTRELYPDVEHFRKPRWMLRRFDLIQPAERTPETDPTFWGTS